MRDATDLTFQIGTGAESPASTSDDAHIQRGLSVEPCPDLIQFGVTFLIDAVQVFGPVQSYEQDSWCGKCEDAVFAAWLWELEVWLGHCWYLGASCNVDVNGIFSSIDILQWIHVLMK